MPRATHQYNSIGVEIIKIIGFAVLKTLLNRCASQRRTLYNYSSFHTGTSTCTRIAVQLWGQFLPTVGCMTVVLSNTHGGYYEENGRLMRDLCTTKYKSSPRGVVIPNKQFRNNSISDVFPTSEVLDTAAATSTCLPSVMRRCPMEKMSVVPRNTHDASYNVNERLTRDIWRDFQ